jgi:plastocyanin
MPGAIVWPLALAMMAGCAGGGGGDADDRVVREGTHTVGSHGYFEVDVRLDAGETLSWEWHVEGAAVHFNVHVHDPEYRVVQSHGSRESHEGSVTAEAAGVYSVYWDAAGAGPEIHYTLRGDGEVVTVRP